jgi:hypothetical protein
MSDEITFERIVRIKPAYDCLLVQPCVHGSEKCGTVPGQGHGRHNAEMHLILRGPIAEVILALGTGWDHPETPREVSIRNHWETLPKGNFVEFHSSVPRYEGHEPQRSTCDTWSGECYGDVGYTMSDEPADLLVRKGSDAAWEWLEATYLESFSTRQEVSS